MTKESLSNGLQLLDEFSLKNENLVKETAQLIQTNQDRVCEIRLLEGKNQRASQALVSKDKVLLNLERDGFFKQK